MLRSRQIIMLDTITADKEMAGYIEELVPRGAVYDIQGWAILPASLRAADAVFLAYGSPGGETLFQIAEKQSRADVSRCFHKPELVLAGWRARSNRTEVPEGEKRITAWAFDSNRATFHELRNPLTLP
jgi:hypothetical protein